MTDRPLIPGELRGYRQFHLGEDGLYPLVHRGSGPWSGEVERACCAAGQDHEAPAADCRCGLYGWYLPGSATVALGPASAVVAARGRVVLGDRGFRAAQARVEAVSLPAAVSLNPVVSGRVRRMLGERYPGTRVYRSLRRMLRDHPPHDVRPLGIDPPVDRSRGYRAATFVLGTVVPLLACALSLLPGLVEALQDWWPVLVVTALGWQAALVWLLTRLLALQGNGPARFGATPPPPE